jgi:hypothetical protein
MFSMPLCCSEAQWWKVTVPDGPDPEAALAASFLLQPENTNSTMSAADTKKHSFFIIRSLWLIMSYYIINSPYAKARF